MFWARKGGNCSYRIGSPLREELNNRYLRLARETRAEEKKRAGMPSIENRISLSRSLNPRGAGCYVRSWDSLIRERGFSPALEWPICAFARA